MSDRLAEKIREALDGGVPLLHREDRVARRKEAEDAIDALVEIAKAAREYLIESGVNDAPIDSEVYRQEIIRNAGESAAVLIDALSALDGDEGRL